MARACGFAGLTIVLLLAVSTAAFAEDIPDLSKIPGAVRAGLAKQQIWSIK